MFECIYLDCLEALSPIVLLQGLDIFGIWSNTDCMTRAGNLLYRIHNDSLSFFVMIGCTDWSSLPRNTVTYSFSYVACPQVCNHKSPHWSPAKSRAVPLDLALKGRELKVPLQSPCPTGVLYLECCHVCLLCLLILFLSLSIFCLRYQNFAGTICSTTIHCCNL